MRFTDLVTPESSPDRYNGKLSQDDSTMKSSGNLFGALFVQTNMTIVVSNS